jgi:hypothetical protein
MGGLTWKKIDQYAIQSSDSMWRIARANLDENVRYARFHYDDGKWRLLDVSEMVPAADVAGRSAAVARLQDACEETT